MWASAGDVGVGSAAGGLCFGGIRCADSFGWSSAGIWTECTHILGGAADQSVDGGISIHYRES